MGNPGCSVACQSQEPQWGRRQGVWLTGTHPPLHAPTHALSSPHSPQSPLQPSSQTSAGITVRPQLLPCTTAPIPTAAQLPAQIILHTPRGAQLPPTVHTQLFSIFSPPPPSSAPLCSPRRPQIPAIPCVCAPTPLLTAAGLYPSLNLLLYAPTPLSPTLTVGPRKQCRSWEKKNKTIIYNKNN